MADHLRPAADPSSPAPMYSVRRIAESLTFIHEILAALEPAPDVGAKLFGLLGGLGRSNDDGDTRTARSGCTDLLRAHPDTSHRFAAFLDDGTPLTTRPRRTTRARTIPAAAPPPPPEKPSHGADPRRLPEAIGFLERVERDAGRVVYRKLFVDVLSVAEDDEDMAADEIYKLAREALGPAHAGLLQEFAAEFLPGEREWVEQQVRGWQTRPRQREKARAASSSHAGAGDALVKAAKGKKPRADEGNGHGASIAVVQSKAVNNKRRTDDGNGRVRGGEKSSSRGGAAAQGGDRDGDDDYAPGSRAKRPHRGGGGGECSGSAAMAPVLGAHASSSENNNKRPLRRAASEGKAARAGPEPKRRRGDGGNDGGESRRFRTEWEFSTRYSKLVATMERATELLETPALGGAAAGDDGYRSVEELFPEAECREFLAGHYGDGWGQVKEALERGGGEGRVRELEKMRHGMKEEEDRMVDEEVQKRWPEEHDRTFARLSGLAMGMVAADEEKWRQDEERRRPDDGGGA